MEQFAENLDLLIKIYVILIGIVIGSFLNVLIYRIPLNLSVVKGSSFCPKCNHKLGFLDLFPVFSYIFLGGKCRYCRGKISPRYPAIELLNGLMYFWVYLTYGFTILSVIYMIVASSLLTLSMIDFDHKIIPDRFNIIILACALVLMFISDDVSIIDRVIGFFAISFPILIVALITGGMGMGDVKLFAACGLLLGWKNILLTMLIASVSAALYGVILMAVKKAKGKSEIPFGPFIAFASFICALVGDRIIDLYLSLFR